MLKGQIAIARFAAPIGFDETFVKGDAPAAQTRQLEGATGALERADKDDVWIHRLDARLQLPRLLFAQGAQRRVDTRDVGIYLRHALAVANEPYALHVDQSNLAIEKFSKRIQCSAPSGPL